MPERIGGFGSADILGAVIDVRREAGSSTDTYPVTTGGPSRGFGTANDVGSTPTTTLVTTTTSWGSGASDAIAQIDRAIEIVSKGRAEMGATQNALGHTINSLGVSAENLSLRRAAFATPTSPRRSPRCSAGRS